MRMLSIRMFLLLAVLLSVAGFSQGAELVHKWSFEGNTLDTSGSGNDGTVNGGTASYVSGQFGQAISLDAGVSVDAAAGTTANVPTQATDSWSMNMWLNIDTPLPSLAALAGFSAREDYSGNETEDEGGTRRIFNAFGGSGDNDIYFWGLSWLSEPPIYGDISFAGNEYASDSQWHMYTFTFDGTTLTGYVDGTAIGTGTPELVDALNDAVFVGGTSLWGSTFAGSFDEFTIWNGALSEGEISDLYDYNAFVTPSVVSPGVGATLVPVETTLEWLEPDTYAPQDYKLYVRADDPNFVDSANNLIDGVSVTPATPTTTYALALDYDTTYYWRVDATDGIDWYTGGPWNFKTTPQTPVVTKDPDSLVVAAGETAVFDIEQVNGTSFKWFKNETELSDDAKYSGTATATLTVTDVQKDNEGAYYCKIINNASPEGVDSNVAGLWTKRQMAHWDFDDNLTDTVDGWVGEYSDPNSPVYDPNSISGKSLKLAGDSSHVSIPGSEDVFNYYPLGQTVSVWVNTTSDDSWYSPIAKFDDAGWAVYVTAQQSTAARFSWGPTTILDIFGGSNIADSNWHLLVHQYDPESQTLKLFVDGVLAAESGVITPQPINVPLTIGADTTEGTWSWNGLIDEVKIWNYALDPYQIAHMYTDVMTDSQICVEPVGAGDMDGDCDVDIDDFAIFAGQWLECNRVPDCK
ncbi:Immunoglobulin I-set domain protein [Anaerohalosphaera lusitana]|uniref:Immunoglobulin I-set domain protein n=1 Tax=Anaerohalosphaera lusitana TaxID=1936003 RepID=A0A1U9NME4_9BACT|nr:LamG-like jellyroll fold domain-containing protein [Anaerohalosphaera lusitana]AQT68760.1 Immunoglobulin I-set domain protein [Anaerohalosphaera lusitana]